MVDFFKGIEPKLIPPNKFTPPMAAGLITFWILVDKYFTFTGAGDSSSSLGGAITGVGVEVEIAFLAEARGGIILLGPVSLGPTAALCSSICKLQFEKK
jgi:hypothetical protein